MNVQLLIDSIVRQVTVLIAQLATSGGIRAPLAHIANQVFVELANELSSQGISRKVSADMFGMALRAYIRKHRRLSEGMTDQGRTLWQAVLEFVRGESMVPRSRLLERFERDGELEVSAILHDLVDSGLLFCSGGGQHAIYRAASDEELRQLSKLSATDGLHELVWVTVFRAGPIAAEALGQLLARSSEDLGVVISELVGDGRIELRADGSLYAREFLIPLGATVGWEAAVFDHIQAVVQTVCQRLQDTTLDERREWVGGSTFTFDIWPGHPLEAAVKGQLDEIRQRCGRLRREVSEYNSNHGIPSTYAQITTYVGQCGLSRQVGDNDSQSANTKDTDHDA